ncbi:hypothetical protein ANCDUO_24724, partial [Ancylostoma duodenale]
CWPDSMRERSGSISTARAMLPLCPSLMPSQVSVIRKSWRHINTKGLITVLSRVFQRFNAIDGQEYAKVYDMTIYGIIEF